MTDTTVQIDGYLERLRRGDAAARNELINHACRRLERLAHKLCADFPGLRRWLDAEDVLQSASIRLARALEVVTPESSRQFFRLAAVQIRRELLDLTRHFHGPQGAAAHHASWNGDTSGLTPNGTSTSDPARLAEWTEWHTQLAELPDEEREVVELLWYHGLTQPEAATLLGIPIRTLKRRWQRARLLLHEKLSEPDGS